MLVRRVLSLYHAGGFAGRMRRGVRPYCKVSIARADGARGQRKKRRNAISVSTS